MTARECDRRDFLCRTAWTAASSLGLVAVARAAAPGGETPPAAPAAAASLPWIRRLLHLYTDENGHSRVEVYPVRSPVGADQDQLLRRTAERVTIGTARAGSGWDFHVANQPTLLVPIFGTMIIGLADGSSHEFGHGDIAFAEDCSGQAHRT